MVYMVQQKYHVETKQQRGDTFAPTNKRATYTQFLHTLYNSLQFHPVVRLFAKIQKMAYRSQINGTCAKHGKEFYG